MNLIQFLHCDTPPRTAYRRQRDMTWITWRRIIYESAWTSACMSATAAVQPTSHDLFWVATNNCIPKTTVLIYFYLRKFRHPPPHPALSRSMIQRDHLQRSINNVINFSRTIIHPTPPPTPPRPVAEHDTTWSSAAEQQPVCGHRRTWVPEGVYLYIYIYVRANMCIYIYMCVCMWRYPQRSAVNSPTWWID